MAYTITSDLANPAVQGVADVSTTCNYPLGTRIQASDPTLGVGEFIYAKGVTSCALGSAVLIDEKDWTTALLGADQVGRVGWAMAAVDAATKYGWFQVSGKAVALVAASFADNAKVYATATAGTVDDAVVAGDRVKNAKSCSAIDTPDTGQAYLRIHDPFMDDAWAA